MVENSLIAVYSLISAASLAAGIKSIDWLISTKYKTKDNCEKCRNNIYEIINKDRDLLVRLDAKLDILLKNFKKGNHD